MDISDKINEFLNDNKKSFTLIEFISKYFDLGSFSEKIQSKFITDGQIRVNNAVIKYPNYKLKHGSKISYGRLSKLYKKENASGHDIDDFYEFLTSELFSISDLNKLAETQSNIVFCFLVYFLSLIKYDDVINSQYGRKVDEYLRNTVNKNGLIKELSLTKQETKGRLLTQKLIEAFKSNENDLANLLKALKNGQYDNQLNNLLRNYGNIIHRNTYKLLIEPMTDSLISNRISIENLLKPFFALEKISNESLKYQHYSTNKKVFTDYTEKAKSSKSNYTKTIFIPISSYLQLLFKSKSKIKEEQFGELEISLLNRRYNINREELTVLFELKNSGNGIAVQSCVSVKENGNFKEGKDKDLAIIQPLEIRSLDLKVCKIESKNFQPTIDLKITWKNANGEKKIKL